MCLLSLLERERGEREKNLFVFFAHRRERGGGGGGIKKEGIGEGGGVAGGMAGWADFATPIIHGT